MDSPKPKIDVYEIVTNRIIELLDQGTIPWQKPWTEAGIPMNLLSKRPYRGINLWLLLSLNYEHNMFLTWDQLKKIGGSVKQGEHGHVVIFWKTRVQKNPNGKEEPKQVPLLRYYKVFNVAQCRELPVELTQSLAEKKNDPILQCDDIIKQMPQCPIIKHKEHRAFYHIADDYINMPRKKSFKDSESYYTTLFHELVHSTGNEKRLNRKTITEMAEFGSDTYGMEELVAEIGSTYLCSSSGILTQQIENSAAYVKGWLSVLRNDKRFIVQASGQAQRAVDYILNQSSAIDLKNEVEQPELLIEE